MNENDHRLTKRVLLHNLYLILLASLLIFSLSVCTASALVLCDPVCSNYSSPSKCSEQKGLCGSGDCGAGTNTECESCACMRNYSKDLCQCMKTSGE